MSTELATRSLELNRCIQAASSVINMLEVARTNAERLLSEVPDLFLICDTRGLILKANHRAADFFGISFEEFSLIPLSRIFKDSEEQVVLEHLQILKSKNSHSEVLDFHLSMQRDSKTVLELDWKCWTLKLIEGTTVGGEMFCLYGRDVTELVNESKIRGRLESEIEQAGSFQTTLFPEPLADSSLELFSFYRPASRLGGDWFRYFRDGNNSQFRVYLGDVTGHGFSAALLTGIAHGAALSIEQLVSSDPDKIKLEEKDKLLLTASYLNQIIRTAGRQERFMTMAFLSLNLESGCLTYLNYAHPPVFLRSKDGSQVKVKKLLNAGARLGARSVAKGEAQHLQMLPGDQIFAYTDGLFENEGPTGKKIVEAEVVELLKNESSVTELGNKLKALIEERWGKEGAEDDLTLVAFRWNGSTSNPD